MAKVEIGAYKAYTVGNGIRFMLNNRLIKEVEVPPELVQAFKTELGVKTEDAPSHFDQATSPEEQAKVVETDPTPLTAADFEEPVVSELPPIPQAPMQQEVVSQQVAEVFAPPIQEQPVPATAFQPDVHDAMVDGHYTVQPQPPVMNVLPVEQAEPGSIHGASIWDMARAMYERFGVYTVWLKKDPEEGEISPLTGEAMPSYERGIAYQAMKRAVIQGRIDRFDYEAMNQQKRISDVQRQQQMDQMQNPQTLTPNQNADVNNFDHRTSVRGANQFTETLGAIQHVVDPVTGEARSIRGEVPAPETRSNMVSHRHPEEEEPLAEPNLNGVPIIRPNW